jgi:hypothetical protein
LRLWDIDKIRSGLSLGDGAYCFSVFSRLLFIY